MAESQEYTFLTQWTLPARVESVWEALSRPELWPKWWPGLLGVVKIAEGDDLGIGAVRRFRWIGWLPYIITVEMRVTEKVRPGLIESVATGDLEGTGVWRLSPEVGGTVASYDWRVRTTKPWMNALGGIGRGLFSWNHDVVMARGRRGLTEWLTTDMRT